MCFLEERCESPQPKEFCWFLDWQKCVTNPDRWGSLSFGSGCSEMHNFTIMTSQQNSVHERHCVFYFARNIMFKHKINYCVAVERMVYFPCIWLCFICVSFEFTLGSCVFTLNLRCYRAQCELKIVSNQHIVSTKNPEHTLMIRCLLHVLARQQCNVCQIFLSDWKHEHKSGNIESLGDLGSV